MLTWKDYQVAEARRRQLMAEAEKNRRASPAAIETGALKLAQRRLAVGIGSWLVSLGLRLQSQSAEVVGNLTSTPASHTMMKVKPADQNC